MRTVVDARWIGEALGAKLDRIERKELRKICEPSLKNAAKSMERAIKSADIPVMSGAMKAAIRAEMWGRRREVRGWAVQLPRRAMLQKKAEKVQATIMQRRMVDIMRQMEGKKPLKRKKKLKGPSRLALAADASGQPDYYPAFVEYGTKRMKARRFMRGPAELHGRPLIEHAAQDMGKELLAAAAAMR